MYKAIGLSAVCMAFALVLMTESYAQSRTAPADESVDQIWARMEREMDGLIQSSAASRFGRKES